MERMKITLVIRRRTIRNVDMPNLAQPSAIMQTPRDRRGHHVLVIVMSL